MIERLGLAVTGTVQGVGFRPHVHRLATELGLSGEVGNDSFGVHIEVEGPPAILAEFQRRLLHEAPPLARIEAIEVRTLPTTATTGFRIASSQRVVGPVTSAPPDTAPCGDCLAELVDPGDRRHRHPFITCTNCGPRFTIITALPYDRPSTTMADFALCEHCDVEYRDPTDRRFHAQPLGCHGCGPRLRLEAASGAVLAGPGAPGQHAGRSASDEVLRAAQRLLVDGAIVAVKGVGGYHLACRADDEEVVATLRRRKRRPGKPFALMVADLDVATRLANVSTEAAVLLTSPAAPIVLLRRREGGEVAAAVAPGNPLIGVMLPSSPLHHLLLGAVLGEADHVDDGTDVLDVLVLTSGNLSEEPLCTDDDDARDRLGEIADAFLLHDRRIAVPCDDSVVRMDDPAGSEATMVRRSRGYVPTPIALPFAGVPALAVGGQLKTTICLTDGQRAWLSPHIGDMGDLATLRVLEATVARFAAMHEVVPARLIADAHPDYTTRRWAERNAEDRPVVTVGHHHAHIAAVMAEHGLDGGSPVLGFAFDGTGYGADGTIWGGEALLADYDGCTRLAHLSTVLLPGGDAAIRHPRRVALSHLHSAGVDWDADLPCVAATPASERPLLGAQLQRGLGCVPTSSMGRLFDAVASLVGVRHDITFEAQAAIELEVLADSAEREGTEPVGLTLPLQDHGPDVAAQLHCPTLIRGIVAALRSGAGSGAIALGFHHAVAEAVTTVAERTRRDEGIDTVALSGGVFANGLLGRLTQTALSQKGFHVLRHRLVPPNDGGLALGQVAIGCRAQTPPSRSDR